MKKITRRIFILSLPVAILSFFLFSGRKRWRYIVIHHSAGSSGNPSSIRELHRKRFPGTKTMAYHFLIGNGNGMGDGEVQSSLRWKYKRWGTHLSIHNKYINYCGIGICLIGNFENTSVKDAQYKSLVGLVKYLMDMYSIPKENVLFHGKIKGESTLCPGRNFPCEKFLNDI